MKPVQSIAEDGQSFAPECERAANIVAVLHGDVIEALTQALEYFEDREDVVDGSYGEPAPNREMSLAQLCRDALQRVR